ncbi:hypothetical protein JCM10450v2_007618 [Rhodotorula kratochvilovae]
MGAGGVPAQHPGPDALPEEEVSLVEAYKRLWHRRTDLQPSSAAYTRLSHELAVVRSDAVLLLKCRQLEHLIGSLPADEVPLNEVIYAVFQAELARRKDARIAEAEAAAREARGEIEERTLGVRRRDGGEGVPLGLRAGWRYFGRAY